MVRITIKRFEKALEGVYGNISAIARKLKVSRGAVYRFLESNPEAQEMVEAEREAFDDIAEETLRKKIMEGDTTLLKFYASTRLKRRGYSNEEEKKTETPEFRVTLVQKPEDQK